MSVVAEIVYSQGEFHRFADQNQGVLQARIATVRLRQFQMPVRHVAARRDRGFQQHPCFVELVQAAQNETEHGGGFRHIWRGADDIPAHRLGLCQTARVGDRLGLVQSSQNIRHAAGLPLS